MATGSDAPASTPLPDEQVRCPECGVAVQPDWDWCHSCGFDPEHRRPAPAPNTQATDARAVAVRRSAAPAVAVPELVAPVLTEDLFPSERRRRRWPWVAAAVVVLVGVAAALVVLRQGPSASARSTKLASRLVTTGDLPSGWTAVPPTSSLAATTSGCLVGPGASAPASKGTVVAAAAFRSKTGMPFLVEQLEQYSPPVGAQARFDDALDHVLHGCPRSTGPARGRPVTGAATVLVNPRLGDQSVELLVPLSNGAIDSVLIARSQGYVVVAELVSRKPADPHLFALVTSAAVTKLLR
jgi:hypothetical protein